MSNPLIQTIRGLPISTGPWFTRENIEDTMDYMPHDGDIIIASYPKTGTTWMQYIVLQIVTKGEFNPAVEDSFAKLLPFMEITGSDFVENMRPPRIYKHHYPYNMVQKNKNAKCIYTYRNPEDTFVSNFQFWIEMRDDMEDFDQFFESYVSGDVAYGRIFEHVRSYWEHKDDDNLLLVSYEKLVEDREREILRIAKFLGEEHYCNLTNDQSLLDKIFQQTSLDYIKANFPFNRPFRFETIRDEESRFLSVDFSWKGTTGESKKELSPEQRKRLKETAAEVLNGTELMIEWFQ